MSSPSSEAAGRSPTGRIAPPKAPEKGDADVDVGSIGIVPRSAAAATAAAAALSNVPSQQGERLVVSLLLSEGRGGELAQERGGMTVEVVVVPTAPSSESRQAAVVRIIVPFQRTRRWTDALSSMLAGSLPSARGWSKVGREFECPRRAGGWGMQRFEREVF